MWNIVRVVDGDTLVVGDTILNFKEHKALGSCCQMRARGFEPPSLAAPDPKSGVSANSTTPACSY